MFKTNFIGLSIYHDKLEEQMERIIQKHIHSSFQLILNLDPENGMICEILPVPNMSTEIRNKLADLFKEDPVKAVLSLYFKVKPNQIKVRINQNAIESYLQSGNPVMVDIEINYQTTAVRV